MILSKVFSASMAFVIGSVYVTDYVQRFAYVKQPLHSRDKPDLTMVEKLFDVLLDVVCWYFIEDFHINVHQGYWTEILFFLLSLLDFDIRMMLASYNMLGKNPTFSIV